MKTPNLKDIYKELLQPFLMKKGQTPLRPVFERPFYDGNRLLCSSCSTAIIRIKSDALQGLGYPVEQGLTLPAEASNCSHIFTVVALQEAYDAIPLVEETVEEEREVTCKHCKGSGEVEWHYVDDDYDDHFQYFTCPLCAGTGKLTEEVEVNTGRMITDPNGIIRICNTGFSCANVHRLITAARLLGLERITLYCLKDQCARFSLTDEVEVFIMQKLYNDMDEKVAVIDVEEDAV